MSIDMGLISSPSARWSVGIVIPARNEQRRIGRCLTSLLAAIDAADVKSAYIVVVADRCQDRTAALARQILGAQGQVIEAEAGSPGKARRIGALHVLEKLSHVQTSRIWLANTDADSFVPCDWIRCQLEMADRGATAVAGVVAVDSFESHGTNGPAVFHEHYVINADGTHGHVHGANLGVRADAYLDAGGWADLPVGEDHHLWRGVNARGWLTQSSASCIVTTSGRLRGRARGGFADTLRVRLRRAQTALQTANGVAP